MGWIIIAIGVVFAAFGGAIAYSGLDYVQVERGWTAVISGTTMLTGGVIAMSIGVVTLKLKKIAGLLQNLSLPEDAVLKTFAPESAPIEPLPPKPPIPVDDAIKSGISLATEREAATATANVAAAGAAVSIGAHSVKPLEAPAALSPESEEPAEEELAEEEPAEEEPPKPESPSIAVYSQNASVSLDWLEDAIAGTNEPVEPSSLSRRAAEPEAALRSDHAPAEPEAPQKAPPSGPAVQAPSVVGRYEAAGTSYAMYSDGSVEAENEHGIFRFASMAELRAFIEEGPSPENDEDSHSAR